jgi:HD superfamily phosphohydrolase
MSHFEKRRFIKDPVWGEVEFFSWERELFDHPLVNRLHGVVQTSCTFKVYPSLKYSRFAHSIGTLHVVTQLFVNIARNLRVNARCASDSSEKKRYHEGVAQFSKETELIRHRFKQKLKNNDELTTVTDILCRAFPVERDEALALAVVRIGALLHDVGHLPYSHLLENTMEKFIHCRGNELKDSPKSTITLRKELDDLAGQFIDRHRKLGKFHEWLGYQFATMMSIDPVLAEDERLRAFLRQAIELARDVWSREMLHEKEVAPKEDTPQNLTPILSSLLSGDIDADRIDFVRRDSLFSGLFACSVDFDRVFDLYEAGKYERNDDGTELADDDGEPKGWAARPSSRSASDAGKLLIERFQLYKYVVAHHRVHLFDEMLERCLMELMKRGRLDQLLKGIKGVLSLQPKRAETSSDRKAQDDLRSYLLHLDDAWLDTQVRAWNIDFSKKEGGLGLEDDPRCKRLFEGFLEKRDHFKSVFKWDRDFNNWWWPEFVGGPLSSRLDEWIAKTENEDGSFPKEDGPNAAACAVFRKHFGADVWRACRGKIVGLLFERRYEFEDVLREAAGLEAVIVGVTGKKVRGNMNSAVDARFFGLMSANEYLTLATLETMVFNIWFVPEDDRGEEQQAQLLEKSLNWLASELLGKLEKSGKTMFEETADEVWSNLKNTK